MLDWNVLPSQDICNFVERQYNYPGSYSSNIVVLFERVFCDSHSDICVCIESYEIQIIIRELLPSHFAIRNICAGTDSTDFEEFGGPASNPIHINSVLDVPERYYCESYHSQPSDIQNPDRLDGHDMHNHSSIHAPSHMVNAKA